MLLVIYEFVWASAGMSTESRNSILIFKRDIIYVIFHPEYYPSNLYNDIAVIKLKGLSTSVTSILS